MEHPQGGTGDSGHGCAAEKSAICCTVVGSLWAKMSEEHFQSTASNLCKEELGHYSQRRKAKTSKVCV